MLLLLLLLGASTAAAPQASSKNRVDEANPLNDLIHTVPMLPAAC